jgi:hypothetical protein
MKKNAIDHQNNEKTERKKNLSVSAKKKNIHVCVPPSIYQKKDA